MKAIPSTKSLTIQAHELAGRSEMGREGPGARDRAGSRTGDVLMFAWMNREALQKTAELGRAVYFSRSRGKLWFKGEESGHVQHGARHPPGLRQRRGAAQGDATGHEPGIACHTGRHSCFFQRWCNGGLANRPSRCLKDPETIYRSDPWSSN
jgi:phosphoribosyl-AMP cyclohydrolase